CAVGVVVVSVMQVFVTSNFFCSLATRCNIATRPPFIAGKDPPTPRAMRQTSFPAVLVAPERPPARPCRRIAQRAAGRARPRSSRGRGSRPTPRRYDRHRVDASLLLSIATSMRTTEVLPQHGWKPGPARGRLLSCDRHSPQRLEKDIGIIAGEIKTPSENLIIGAARQLSCTRVVNQLGSGFFVAGQALSKLRVRCRIERLRFGGG